MFRKRVRRSKDRRVYSRTAARVHKKNILMVVLCVAGSVFKMPFI